MVQVVAGKPGTAEKALDASPLAAITRRPGTLVVAGPRQGIVAPFAGDGVAAGEYPPADDQAAADAGAEDDPEYNVMAGPGPVGGLGDGEAVGVVGETHGAAEGGFEVLVQGPADERGRVGVLDHARGRRKGAGDADADAADLSDTLLHGSDQVGDDVRMPG